MPMDDRAIRKHMRLPLKVVCAFYAGASSRGRFMSSRGLMVQVKMNVRCCLTARARRSRRALGGHIIRLLPRLPGSRGAAEREPEEQVGQRRLREPCLLVVVDEAQQRLLVAVGGGAGLSGPKAAPKRPTSLLGQDRLSGS